MEIKKLTVGVRLERDMFRLMNVDGYLIDVLKDRAGKVPDEKYFAEIVRGDHGMFILQNKERGNLCHIDSKTILFAKDAYKHDGPISIKAFLKEWEEIWKEVNKALHVDNIRRVGVVAEHRFPALDGGNGSRTLLKSFTALPMCQHPAKFIMRYEDRRIATRAGALDVHKDDFENVIHDYYDSAVDADAPINDHINVNIDVQRYYTPLRNGGVVEESRRLATEVLKKEQEAAKALLKEKGIIQ